MCAGRPVACPRGVPEWDESERERDESERDESEWDESEDESYGWHESDESEWDASKWDESVRRASARAIFLPKTAPLHIGEN